MSFITDYLKTTENTESPFEYHVWSMLATLSTLAGRRFWFPFGPYVYYPNLYVVLVGDPGITKSSAMGRAKGIIRVANTCPVAATQITKEALTLKMSSTVDGTPKKVPFIGQRFFVYKDQKVEYNQYAIFATELVDFIAVNPQGFLDFLTAVWDEPIIEVETKNKGCDYVAGPYITLLACMTPEKLKGYMKLSILTGGFARRAAFVYAANGNIVPIPSYTEEQKVAEQRCIEFAKRVQSRSGIFGWTDECREFYTAWYYDNTAKQRDRSPSTRGWFKSKGEMLFKLSMLIAIAEESPLVIDLPHYKLALRFCEMVEKNLDRVFEGTGINPNAAAASQISRMLEAMDKPMPRKHIEAMFFDQATSLNELRDTIQHLISVGRLVERTVTVSGQLLGTVLGTSVSMSRCTDVELALMLQPRGLVVPSDTGSSPLERQSVVDAAGTLSTNGDRGIAGHFGQAEHVPPPAHPEAQSDPSNPPPGSPLDTDSLEEFEPELM